MGELFKIINPVKKQYIDAQRFSENAKNSGILRGNHAIAVALLVCNVEQVGDYWKNHKGGYGELAGSWYADPIIIAGDDYGQPDMFGIKTSTEENPERNLNWMAKEEFEDISYKAIAMICEGREGFAEELAEEDSKSVYADRLLVHLGNVVFYVGCAPLEKALAKYFGDDWVSRYKTAREKAPQIL
jgi:hypothetical protein